MHIGRGLIFIFFSLYSLLVSGQELVFRHYDLQDGLASPTIHSIFQDRDGFIWFGTESGLCRYDGNEFKTFTVKEGLPGNDVFGMFQDHEGRMWLQLYKNTIAYVHKGKVYNQQNDSLLKKIKFTSRVLGIAEDREGRIALCDAKSVLLIEKGKGSVSRITTSDNKPLNFVHMYVDDKKNIVVVSHHDLYTINNLKLIPQKRISRPSGNMGPTDVLFTSTYTVQRVFSRFNIYLKDTIISTTDSLNKAFILKFSPISDSLFSINTTDGTLLFNLSTRSFQKILAGAKVSNVYFDREQNLWIGTIGRGIYKLSSRYIVNNRISEGENDIHYLSKAGKNIIAGNNNGGIYNYHSNSFTVRDSAIRGEVPMRKVFYYEEEDKNTAIMVHGMGLVRYDNAGIKSTIPLSMLKQAAPAGEDCIFVAVDTGLYKIRKKDFTTVDAIWKRKTLSFSHYDDTMWVGTLGGLYVLKKTNNKYAVIDSLFPSSIVSFIQRSSDGLLWVATYEHGLYCLRNSTVIQHFTDTSGLPSNNGRSLFINGNDVWEGTDKGLVKITTSETGFAIKKYSVSDGLPSNIVNSIYIEGSMVYIGTPEGLCYFDEHKIETTSMCNLVLTGVSIGGKPVDMADSYTLNRNRQVNLAFSGISFRSEHEMKYRYRIVGLDNDWRTTNLNSLEFTSLPYGSYPLEIVAINKFGKESKPVRINFSVEKPFYLTTWFIILAAVGLIAAILFFYNRHLGRRKQKQLEKLKHEIKILELEQMALRAQMNPHFIFNCVNVMQQLVVEKDQQNAEKFLSSFSNLVRQTLDNATELYIPIKEEIKFLTSYFELERIRLEDRFSYVINTGNIPEDEKIAVPNMVIQPFVENAIKHGIRYKKNGHGFVKVDFYRDRDLLCCTVEDNGIGRKRAEQIRKELGIAHISRGMSITSKRIESLNALTGRKISVVIQDLKNKDDEAIGTKVIIEFLQQNIWHDQNSNY